jgi:hypothetical protein
MLTKQDILDSIDLNVLAAVIATHYGWERPKPTSFFHEGDRISVISGSYAGHVLPEYGLIKLDKYGRKSNRTIPIALVAKED